MKISVKAIIIGYIFCALFSLIQSLLFANLRDVLGPEIYQELNYWTYINLFDQIISILKFLLTGYITAWIAKNNEIKHGLIIGILIIIISILINIIILKSGGLEFYFSSENYFGLYNSISILGCFGGAFIRKRINDKKKEMPPKNDFNLSGQENQLL